MVRTAIDMNVQRAAEEAIENQLRQFGRDYHATQAATVVADLDGGVRAMVGGRDYGASQFNRAIDAYRQPGSSFKPYVYTTALLNGFKPTSIVVDGPVCIGNWCPQNYGHSYSGAGDADAGDHPIDQRRSGEAVDRDGRQGRTRRPAAPRSSRSRAASASRRRCRIRPRCRSAPTKSPCSNMRWPMRPSRTRAKSVTPHAVLEVRTGAGDLVWRFDRDGKKPLQAIPASVAADMAGMMSHVVSEGTARRAALDGIPTAGKTGTTNAYRDAWFVGYTGNFTCAVWYGNDDYSPTNRMTGGSLPAQTWHDIMVAAHQGVEIKEIAGRRHGHQTAAPARPPRRRGQRRAEGCGSQAGTAAGPDQARRGYSGAGGENARRSRPRPPARLVSEPPKPVKPVSSSSAGVPG